MRTTTPTLPQMKAIFWCLGERRRQARAITTALSPLRTMLMTLICASEISASDKPGISIGQDPFLMGDGHPGAACLSTPAVSPARSLTILNRTFQEPDLCAINPPYKACKESGCGGLVPLRRPRRPLRFETLEGAENLFAQPCHFLAFGGDLDAPALGEHHRRAHRVGETAQQSRDGGLREAQLVGCARDPTQAQAGLESDELRKQSVAKERTETWTGHGRSP